MKYLRVTMPDGTIWEIPAERIAENRARYYSDRDEDTTFQEEFDYTMGENSELLDWAPNNMDWADVEDVATMTDAPGNPDYNEGWVNADKEIVEH